MTQRQQFRTPTDDDIDAYSNYIAKLAAIASPGDPPVTPFRVWFFWHYNAFPAAPPTHDNSTPLAA
jgi:hypothetical protein